jgi:endo-1,4-beta-D-glucanase Y
MKRRLASIFLAGTLAACGVGTEAENGARSLPSPLDGATTLLSLDGIDFPTKTTGEAADRAWNLYTNGYVEATVTFPKAGSYVFQLRAHGDVAANEWPTMELQLDGKTVEATPVASHGVLSFTFTEAVGAGAHTIAIAFTNDYASESAQEDRNLYVDHLLVTAGGDVAAPPPPPPIDGLAYPFASHRTPYVAGITPSVASQASQDALIGAQYDSWKAAGVQARCGGYVVVFDSSYATVSEGAGYGMLLTVLMAGHDKEAKTVFDGLLHVVRSHPAYNTGSPALMDWRVNADCSGGGEGWNAMDGDLDIAMALLMADKQWGSSGAVDYRAEALSTIAALKAYNMTSDGRTKGLPSPDNNRTSDYMITHFKAFGRATNDAFWGSATDKAFYLLDLMQSNFAPATGLIPDFIIDTGTNPAASPGFIGDGNANEGFYYWNACRIPWRLASDYVTSGDTRSKTITSKLMDFFNNTTGGNPGLLSNGYKLDGTSLDFNPGYVSPSFVGPIATGAMVDNRFEPFLNNLWTWNSNHLASGYYDTELQLLSLTVASGNWWNP